jgi:hypothetical protein
MCALSCCACWRRRSCADAVVGRFHGFEIRLQRRLRVDNDAAVVRQAHDHVRPHPAILAVDRLLLHEVAILEHAGHLDDTLELDLAPAAAHLRRAQRADEVLRLQLQCLLRLCQCADLLGQRAVRGCADLLEVANACVDLVERLAQRLDQSVDLAGARLELALRELMLLTQRVARDLEERLVVLRQCVCGQSAERISEFALGVIDQRDLLGGRAAFLLEALRERAGLDARGRDLALQLQQRASCSRCDSTRRASCSRCIAKMRVHRARAAARQCARRGHGPRAAARPHG